VNTFTQEEEKLVIIVAACFIMATAVFLCCPEYGDNIAFMSKNPSVTTSSTPGSTPVKTRLKTDKNNPTTSNNRSNTTTHTRGGSSNPRLNNEAPIYELTNKVDPNFATYEELLKLPGIGPSTARALLSYREKNLIFSVNDLKRIKGIGPAKLAKLKQYIVFAPEKRRK